jgi:hypothetical protein
MSCELINQKINKSKNCLQQINDIFHNVGCKLISTRQQGIIFY